MSRSPKQEPKETTIPFVRYNEVPNRVMRDFVLGLFKEEIRERYTVMDIVRMQDGDWLVKLEAKVVQAKTSD